MIFEFGHLRQNASSPIDYLPIKYYVRDKTDAFGALGLKLGGPRLSGDQCHIRHFLKPKDFRLVFQVPQLIEIKLNQINIPCT